ncbi:hypothetical protein JW979_08820 [bacterium]|nr:hypothetical protein [candidate division CSSED10-310 bacterium]
MRSQSYLLTRVVLLFSILLLAATFANAEVYMWIGPDNIFQLTNIKPDWWTEDMDQMAPSDIRPPDVEKVTYPGKYVGDKENRKFHLPSCEQIYTSDGKMAIPDNKIIWFQSTDEAISLGYIACDHCKPLQSNEED